MRAEAAAGVASLAITRQPDGAGAVSVNGRLPFRLQPKLAAFLAVLAVPAGRAEDGLVEWHSKAELAAALNKNTGGTTAPHGVAKLVYGLREAFRDAGENWLLIQTNRERGVRVALRA